MEYVLTYGEDEPFEADDALFASELDDIADAALEEGDDEPEVYYGIRPTAPGFNLRGELLARCEDDGFWNDEGGVDDTLDDHKDKIAEAQKIIDEVLGGVAMHFWFATNRRVDPARVTAAMDAARARAASRQRAPIDAMEGGA